MQRSAGGKDADARKAAAIPPSPMRAPLAFAPVAGFSFGKSKQPRATGAAPAKKPAPFVIAAGTTNTAGKQPHRGKTVTAPFSLGNKCAVGAGGLKFGFPPAIAPAQQQPQAVAKRPPPGARSGIARDSSVKTGAVGRSGGGALLPQAFSWDGFAKSGPQKSTAVAASSCFSKPTTRTRYKASHGTSTPTPPRKIPLIPTLMTPTRSPGVGNAAAITPTASINFIKPDSASKKRAPPCVILPSPDAFRSAKRPKQTDGFVVRQTKHSPLASDCSNFSSNETQTPQSLQPGSVDKAVVAMPATSASTAWDPSSLDEPMEDSAAEVASSPLDISREIVLLPLSLSDYEDEDLYDRVKRMHALLEQTSRERQEAHDRLLQSHAELSESLLDAITDLVAESGGCGLDQLLIENGAVGDSVVTDTPDLRALRCVTG